MLKTQSPDKERGMALVIAILVLLVLTLLGVVMMASVVMNRQVAGQSMMMRRALNTAEAGVGEAVAQMRKGTTGMDVSNARSTAQIFLAAAGSVPGVGVDTVAIATAQPVGSWLPYSTSTKGPNVLTITYKTNPARTAIYTYNTSTVPAIQLSGVGGLPIYTITSTGTAGAAKRTIVTDVTAKPIYASVRGAMTAGFDVGYGGTAKVCGHNHMLSTPSGTTADGVACAAYETHNGDLPATWSTGSVTMQGNSGSSGAGAAPYNLENQTGFPSPWQLLNMSQVDFNSFLGPRTTSPASLYGITYIDNDAVVGNQSASYAIHGDTGEGLLYVDGDLSINAGFSYVGLIYVEGNLHMNGHAWILGGIVVRGRSDITVNGTADILYSSDAISQSLGKYGGQFTTLSWREK